MRDEGASSSAWWREGGGWGAKVSYNVISEAQMGAGKRHCARFFPWRINLNYEDGGNFATWNYVANWNYGESQKNMVQI